MATNNKTSVLVEKLLPDYLDTEGPKFQTFIKAYYEWMETSGQMTEQSKNLLNNQDLDLAAESFLKYFKREILSDFPETILANKRLVYKKIKDLYRSKGSEESYKLLFRILYDEELDFYYPGDYVLRASDGRWLKETSIRVTKPFRGNIEDLAGTVTGRASKATAKVERVQLIHDQNVSAYEVFISNKNGTFLDAEELDNTGNTISGTLLSYSGSLQGTIIIDGGANHQKNDLITITSSSGSGGRATVLKTASGVITNISVTNTGSGFLRSDALTLNNTTRSATDAKAAPLLSVPVEYTGRYTGTQGFISWSNRLQDNRYYQDYSYVLRSSQVLETYKEIVKDIVHPAGMRVFGDVLLNIDIDSSTTSFKNEFVLHIGDIIPQDIFIPTVVSASIEQYESSGDDGAIVPRPELEIELLTSVFDTGIDEAQTGFEIEIALIAAQQSALQDADAVISVNIQRIVEGFTLNETANVALVQIGDIFDPTVRTDTGDYNGSGSLWLAANGDYFTLGDGSTTFNDEIARSLHTIPAPTILRSAGFESISANTMTYADLPLYALADLVPDDWPHGAQAERLELTNFSSEQINGQVFGPPTGDFDRMPSDYTLGFRFTLDSIASTAAFGTSELLDRTIDIFTQISEMEISVFSNIPINNFQGIQIGSTTTIPTTTDISANTVVTGS